MGTEQGKVASALECTTKFAVALAAAAYVCGVLILNVHLGRHGFPTGDLGDARYVATGALWLFLVGIHAVVLTAAGYIFRNALRLVRARKIFAGVLVLAGLPALAWAAAVVVEVSSFTGIEVRQPKVWHAVVMFALTALVLLFVPAVIRSAQRRPTDVTDSTSLERNLAFLGACGQLLLLLLALVAYAVDIYPRFPAVIGGGSTAPILLAAASPEDAARLSALGFRPTQAGFLSADLVFEDSSSFYTLTEWAGRRKAVRFAKDDFHIVLTDID